MRYVLLVGYLLLVLIVSPNRAEDEHELPSLVVITAENAQRIGQIGMLGYGLIQDTAYSPDGEIVAVAGSLGLVFYDANEFEYTSFERWMLPEEMVFAVAYHPNGTILATASGERLSGSGDDKVFRIWDIDTQTPLAEWFAPYHRQKLAFSPDGNELAIMGKLARASTLRWDVTDPSNIFPLPELPVSEVERQWAKADEITLPQRAYAVTYSPDGRYVAYADQDVYLVDAVNGELLFTLEPDTFMRSEALYFLPNSQVLVSLAYLEAGIGVIEAWDTTTGEKVLYEPTGGIRAFGLHPTESVLVFSRWNDAGMRRWQSGVDAPEYVLGQDISPRAENRYTKIVFNADGSILAALHAGFIEFWDVRRGVKVRDDLYFPFDDTYTTRNVYEQIAYSPDGRYFAAAGGGEIQLYDAKTMLELGRTPYEASMLDLEFSPDGNLLASYHFYREFPEERILVWNVEAITNGDPTTQVARIGNFNILGRFAFDLTFSPDGDTLAISGVGAQLWDVSSVLNTEEIGFDAETTMGLTTHSALVGNLGGHESAAPLAFSPDGSFLATGSHGIGCYAAVWNVQSEELVACLGAGLPQSNSVRAFRFLSETLLITGAEQLYYDLETLSTTLRIWDITIGELLIELEGHFEDYNDIAISPDGKLIVSAGGGSRIPRYDISLRIWGVPDGQ